MTTHSEDQALTRVDRQSIQAAAAQGALPVVSAELMVAALDAYRDLQKKLDKSMPDQIMELEGKPFRKKGYWRAVALAFNLSVDPVEEKRIVSGTFKDGRENFGWIVTYRASHPLSGRSQTGDGACFAVEKARRFRCPHPHPEVEWKTLHFPQNTCPQFDPDFQWKGLPAEATEHNVRGHAHTRAYNRAVSNLVGFGEVSAEEVERDEDHQPGGAHAAKAAGSGRTAAVSQSAQGQTTAPAASQAAGDGVTTVKAVTKKNGKTGGKAWTRIYVTFDDGRAGVTFDTKLGEKLEAARDAQPKLQVRPELEKTAKGVDLKGLLPLHGPAEQKTAPAPPPPEDEPVNGPEKVLTVRKVLRADQTLFYVIQTSKRVLYTDDQSAALACVQARKDGVGIIPSFEKAAWTGQDHQINKLTGLKFEDKPAAPKQEREVGADDGEEM